VLLIAGAQAARACVVGTGTIDSCTEAALDACLPGGAGFTGAVTFNCGPSPATITITDTGNRGILPDTTVDGGNLVTISGGGILLVPAGVTFTVENLTIANGLGIGNQGTLTVTNSTFSDNMPLGAIRNSGTLTVTNSTFSGNTQVTESPDCCAMGSAINNSNLGAVTVTNSTFSGNTTYQIQNFGVKVFRGGAISNLGGTLTVTNSTFSGNNGGAIYNTGGAIFDSSTVTVTDSTFSGNSADAGGSIDNEAACGDTGNAPCSATLRNTIVANNTGGNCTGAIANGGHNIDDGTSCGFSTANGSLSNTDPQLDPAGLKANGGPTQTIALLAGSPAINAGDQNVCAAAPVNNLDQRGYVRPGVGHTQCSIGAYEADAVPAAACVGDCNANGTVTIDELVKGVNIALGRAGLDACPAFDCHDNGQLAVDCLVQGVNHALTGCPVCGNGIVEGDEQCDDGNTVGGDGCAANCTREDRRTRSWLSSLHHCCACYPVRLIRGHEPVGSPTLRGFAFWQQDGARHRRREHPA
jgi:cysteine-rich repeat protein